MDERACEFVSISWHGYWVYSKFMIKFMRTPIHRVRNDGKLSYSFVIFCLGFVVASKFTMQKRIRNSLSDTMASERIVQLKYSNFAFLL